MPKFPPSARPKRRPKNKVRTKKKDGGDFVKYRYTTAAQKK